MQERQREQKRKRRAYTAADLAELWDFPWGVPPAESSPTSILSAVTHALLGERSANR
jgi:hypothetical protein